MNILAIDDEKRSLNVLIKAIEEAIPKSNVHGFREPLEGLELMQKIKCDVAFLDIQMPKINGIMLAKKLKEIYPKVNIIFVTGFSDYTDEAFVLHASGYVYKPVTEEKIILEMENLRYPVKWKDDGVFIRTFGKFELIANGEIVSFKREKAKEMLAYLIDKKGQSVTRKELATVLFENEEYSRSTQDYLSKIITELVRVLEEISASKILKRGINSYAIDVNEVKCDLYDYEKDNATPEEINSFKGEYSSQYSWSEVTLARLYWKNEKNTY